MLILALGYPCFLKLIFLKAEQFTNSLGKEYIFLPKFHFKSELLRNFRCTRVLVIFLLNEIEESDPTALGGHSEKELQHNAISIYSRMFYHLKSKNESFQQYYFGGTFGAYLWSKTTGESSWWIMGNPKPSSGSKIYNESGKAFFHSVYLGLTAGIKLKTKEFNKIQPAFEFSFYPLFVTVNDEKRSMAMLAVVLGIGQKKTTRINE